MLNSLKFAFILGLDFLLSKTEEEPSFCEVVATELFVRHFAVVLWVLTPPTRGTIRWVLKCAFLEIDTGVKNPEVWKQPI